MKSVSLKSLLAPSTILLASAVLLEVIALILYSLTGVNEFNETLSAPVLIFAIVAGIHGLLLLLALILALDRYLRAFDALVYLAYILGLLAFVFYIGSQANYLASVFVSIDGTSISAVFVLTVALLLLSSFAFLFAGIFLKKKAKAEEGGDKE